MLTALAEEPPASAGYRGSDLVLWRFSEVESPALINAKWWVGVWETIEHWAFLGVVLTLAIEFAASHLAKPHRKIIDNARELEMVRLNHEADMAKGQIADATARAAEAQLALAKN